MTDVVESNTDSGLWPDRPFASDAPRHVGGETVVNPERRAHPQSAEMDSPETTSPFGAVDPEVRRRLFPATSDSDSGAPLPDPRGLQFEHFTIEGRIAAGGMGSVFRATDERLHRLVALKILPAEQSADPAVVQRFLNEARSAARLDHTNVVRVFYVGRDHGLHFIAYEFVDGTNVRDLIRRSGRLDVRDAVNYTLQLALALVHTSEMDVVHRDIKPSNVIITEKGRAKLVDLGLARRPPSPDGDELTIAGTTLGTFDYISPEQAKDPRSVDVRSDVYSLGCTLYHMLTGEPPYSEGTVLQKLLDHQGKEPPDPSVKNRHVPPPLAQLCRRMMASDPSKRPRDADRLVRELSEIAAMLGMRAAHMDGLAWSNAAAAPTFWEKHLGWMSTVAALVLIVAVVEWLPDRTEPEEPRGVEVAGPSASDPRGVDGAKRAGEPAPVADVVAGGANAGGSEALANVDDPVPRTSEPPSIFEGIPNLWRPDKLDLPPPLRVEKPQIAPLPKAGEDTAVGTATTPEPMRGTKPEPETVPDPTIGPPPETEDSADGPDISIVTADEEVSPRSFDTLEAAVAAAHDGDIVELAFDGVRQEKPVNVGKKRITIRAAKDFHPVVRFVHEYIDSEGDVVHMISVAGGAVDVVNLEMILEVDDTVPIGDGERWALLRVTGGENVRLRNSTVTVRNPAARPVAVVDLGSGHAADVDMMKMMTGSPADDRPRGEVAITNCLVRGDADAVHLGHTRPLRIDVTRSVLAVDQSLLAVTGNGNDPGRSALVDLVVEHVTGVVGNGLIRFDAGDVPRYLPPLRVIARNNVFATPTSVGFVTMTGSSDAQDFRTLLNWNGEQNFYDRFDTFWTIADTGTAAASRDFDFEAWKRTWEARGAHSAVVWAHDWSEFDLGTLPPSALALDASSTSNPAVGGATDGTNAGANLAEVGPALNR